MLIQLQQFTSIREHCLAYRCRIIDTGGFEHNGRTMNPKRIEFVLMQYQCQSKTLSVGMSGAFGLAVTDNHSKLLEMPQKIMICLRALHV
jgi:hypothetical protein